MKKQFYSLQGIIFQAGHVYGTAYKPGVGTTSTVEKAMIFAMFHSIVSAHEPNPAVMSGAMSDRWGESIITDFILNENGVTFQKQYSGRPPISYSFRECKGNIWYGTYTGLDCGQGTAKLIATPIEESFFFPVDEK